jgi:hypothetical protein
MKGSFLRGLSVKRVLLTGASLAVLSSVGFAGSPEVEILQQISTSVNQLSTQLTQMADTSQQNWANYFNLEANTRFSPESYPEWQKIQSDFSSIQSGLNVDALVSMTDQASQEMYDPALSKYSSSVDQIALNMASSAISQVSQANQRSGGITEAVALPLGAAWQQDLSTANEIQLLKAISAQLSTNNALLYSISQQSQAQQLLLSRLVVEMTQLNQDIRQLNAELLNHKAQ